MTSTNSKAVEFLETLRLAHKNPFSYEIDSRDKEFEKIHLEKRGLAGMSQDPSPPELAFDKILKGLWDEVIPLIPEQYREKLRSNLAVGVIDNIEVNALSARSPQGLYAIALNAGLMVLFNKISKILIAGAFPDSVVYSNRIGKGPVPPEEARAWRKEVCENYIKTKSPVGPKIHLEKRYESNHLLNVISWEIFVLCHEVGHVVLGHLENPGIIRPLNACPDSSTLKAELDLMVEIQADLFAYLIMRDHIHKALFKSTKPEEDWDDRLVLDVAVRLFDVFSLLGHEESKSHPDPLVRILSVVQALYGEEFAEKLEMSYSSRAHAEEIYRNPLRIRKA